MKTVEEEVEKYKRSEYQPLIPLPEFRRSGRAPADMHHLILLNKESLEEEGVIVRYGNRWLVSEPELYRWLRVYGKNAGHLWDHLLRNPIQHGGIHPRILPFP